MKRKSKVQKLERVLDDELSEGEMTETAEAIESGYHPPTQDDIRDIKHDHNTAKPGSITADEAVRRGA